MRQRIGVVLENVGLAILRLSDRVRGIPDIGEGWWSLGETKPLTHFERSLTFGDYDTPVNRVEYGVATNVVLDPRKPKIVREPVDL